MCSLSVCSSYSSIFYWVVCLQFSSVQSLSCVRLFVTQWTAACQASLSIANSRSPPKPISIESVMPSNHLILCHPFSPPAFSLFQHQGLFQCQLFTSGGQSIVVSASVLVLPMNIQDWFPLGWTGWISMQSCLLYYLLQFFMYFACNPFIMCKCCKYLLPVCVFFFLFLVSNNVFERAEFFFQKKAEV